jgi:hypothetical protein
MSRTHPLWLLPAILVASSFCFVCGGTSPVSQSTPAQPPPPILIERALSESAGPLVFPPPSDRHDRLPMSRSDDAHPSAEFGVASPSLDSGRVFSFHGTSFRVAFNQPVERPRPEAGKKDPTPAAPGTISITPSVEGEARWIDDRTLEFVAKRPFDTETTYAVEVAAIKTPAGSTLKEPWKATFTATPGVTIAGKELSYLPVSGKPRVITMHPGNDTEIGARETFAVLYDQPIALPLARTRIMLVDASTDNPIPAVFDHPKSPTFQGVTVDPRFVVLVRPAAPLKSGTDVLFAAQSRLADTHDFDIRTHKVQVAGALALQDVACDWVGEDHGGQNQCSFDGKTLSTVEREVHIRFNYAIATPDDKLRQNVRVTPAVRNLIVRNEPWANEIVITGAFEPSKTYDVTVEAVTDEYDSRLGKAVRFRVETASVPASATMADGNLWLDAETTRRFAVTTRNVSEAVILAWPVPAGDRAAMDLALDRVRSRELPPEDAPVRIVIPIKAEQDKLVTTNVDLSAKLSAGTSYLATLRAEKFAFNAKLAAFPRGSEAAAPLVALLRPGDAQSLAVHTRAMPNATLVHVARIGSGEPVANALVRLAGDESAQAVSTDAAGVALLPFDLRETERGFLDVRAQGAELALPLEDESLSERQLFPDLAARDNEAGAAGRRAFVITDRGIYRPGSKVFVKATLRRPDGARLLPIENESVKVHVVGPTGDDVFAQTMKTNDMGSVAATVALPPEAKIGRHQILLEKPEGDDLPLARAMVQVAEFEPPRFFVDVDASADAKNILRAEVHAKYLFGAPMDGAQASWTVRREAASFPEGPLTAAGLVFRRTPHWYDDDEQPWSRAGEGSLSEHGKMVVSTALEVKPELGPQRFVLEADVTDASYRHVAGRASILVNPAKRYAGLRLGGSWFGVGEKVPVDLGVIDAEGKPVEGAAVVARLERVEWRYTRRRGAGGSLEWDWSAKRVEAGRCSVTSTREPARCTLDVTRSGSYEVIAEVDGRRGGTSGLWAYGSEGEALPAAPDRPHTVELASDKPRYAPGETAKILVRSPYPEATLVTTVEGGDLLEKRSMRVKAGATVLDVPLRAEHAPHVHATVTLLPIGAKGRAVADYKIGAVRLPVSISGARLEIAARSDKPSYGPGEEAEVAVELKDGGKPEADAEIALAIVDEGVLRLTDFHPVDPVTALRPRRGLSFRVRDSRSNLGELFERSHVPGDGGGAGLATITEARKKFVETALFRPDLRTDANGRASVRFKLPDNLTTFRIMAVAVDREGKGANTEASFLVQKPVMLVPIVPRFALTGDRFEAAAMLHNQTDKPLAATVKLGAKSQSVSVPAGGHTRVGFGLEPSAKGTLPLMFSVLDGGGRKLDEVEAKLPVEEPGIDERPRLDGAFVGAREISLEIPATVIERGAPEVVVQIGEHLWPELGARLEYLLGYPHGCVEQTTSSTLPLIAARTILPRIGLSKMSDAELARRIDAGLKRLGTMRTDSGGLAYWPGGREPNVYGTAYAIRAVLLAKQAGVEAPAGMLEGMTKYLGDAMLASDTDPEVYTEPEVSAAIAQSLAEAGALEPSAADALFDKREAQSVFGLASLAMALGRLPGQEDRVSKLLDSLEKSFDDKGELSVAPKSDDFHYYGSSERSRAQAAIALARLRRSSTILPTLLRRIANDTEGYTTQATAYSLLALAEHLSTSVGDGAPARVRLDGQEIAAAKDLGFGSGEFRIPVAKLRGKKAKLVLEGGSNRSVGYAISSSWQRAPTAKDTPAASRAANGPSVYRVHSDPRGGAVDLSKVHAGDLLRVALYIRLPELDSDRRGYVAVTDRLPAGFEPVQPDLSTVASAPQIESHHPFADALRYQPSEASHIEMRDDRVNVYFDRVWGSWLSVTYLVRATTPGHFALPAATGELMYEPDGVGWSDAGEVTIQ